MNLLTPGNRFRALAPRGSRFRKHTHSFELYQNRQTRIRRNPGAGQNRTREKRDIKLRGNAEPEPPVAARITATCRRTPAIEIKTSNPGGRGGLTRGGVLAVSEPFYPHSFREVTSRFPDRPRERSRRPARARPFKKFRGTKLIRDSAGQLSATGKGSAADAPRLPLPKRRPRRGVRILSKNC